MKRILPFLAAALLLAAGCAGEEKPSVKTVFAMDTVMELTAYGNKAEAALSSVEKEIFRIDAALDRRDSGEAAAVNENGGGKVSDETAGLIKRAVEISRSTGGAFDITVAPVVDLWGFYDKAYRVPSEQEIAAALEKVGYENISVDGGEVKLKPGSRIDLGGIAKGYASERAAELLRENGVSSGIVSLGGNVMAVGSRLDGKPWRVAVQNPDGGEYAGVVEVRDMAVVTSGDYQRFFEKDGKRYHHIIDPETGFPADSGLRSVTVVCSSGVLADGLSTALFVMGLDRGAQYWRENGGFEAIFIADGGEIYITAGLENSFSGNEYKLIEK